MLERRITLATECFTRKLPELALYDRNRVSKENAMTICDYIIAMKREINPRYTMLDIQFSFFQNYQG